MLTVSNIDVAYSESVVLQDVSMNVGEKDTVFLIGRNGAGKTTLLKTIVGLLTPTKGEIEFLSKNIHKLPPHKVSNLGIGYVPQDQDVFGDLTVEQNIQLALVTGGNPSVKDEIFTYFPVLKKKWNQKAGTLSGGERKMLAMSMVLLKEPKLLILDEPTEGIQPSIVDELSEIISEIGKGCSVLLVEQNLKVAFSICKRGYVLNRGEIVDNGTADELEEKGSLDRYLAF